MNFVREDHSYFEVTTGFPPDIVKELFEDITPFELFNQSHSMKPYTLSSLSRLTKLTDLILFLPDLD